jgi:NifB/MoaA-like Fe-S oxidoreductase
LYPLEPFTKDDAGQVLDIIHRWQDKCMASHGTHFIHASDEWYLLAERELPEEDNYDGYIQLENGVGMLRLLIDEFREALSDKTEPNYICMPNSTYGSETTDAPNSTAAHTISLATGLLAAPFIAMLAGEFMERFPEIKINVYPIRNDFFGERITVSGLITGQDLIAQLKGKELGERLLLPCNMFKSGEEILLDDLTRGDLENTLQVKVCIVKSSGQDLLDAFQGKC